MKAFAKRILTAVLAVTIIASCMVMGASAIELKTGIGITVILSCALLGSPEFTIRWYRNTQLVLPSEAISIRGLSNETLLITSAQKSHSGAYQCFATRKTQTAQDFAIIVLEGE